MQQAEIYKKSRLLEKFENDSLQTPAILKI